MLSCPRWELTAMRKHTIIAVGGELPADGRNTAPLKRMIPILLSFLLLSGCTGVRQDEKRFSAFREELGERGFTASVTLRALCGEEERTFSAELRRYETETLLSVTAPALIAGVTVRLTDETRELSYDTVVLSLPPSRGGLDPCEALLSLPETVLHGRLLYCWRERDSVVYELEHGDGTSLRLFFDGEGFTPTHAEYTEDGRSVVFCNIENFTLREG